jgi:hypothetical protein
MRKANLERVAGLKCAPSNLEKALLKAWEKHPNREYWVDEMGSSVEYSLPRFYYKDGNEEREISVVKSSNQVPRISIGSTLITCHRLVGAAFVENPDPDVLTQVDHICDPNDWVLVSHTILIFHSLKWYEPKFKYGEGVKKKGNSHSLAPHMVNYMPRYLKWVKPGENMSRASTPAHKEFLEKIKEMSIEEALRHINLSYDELNELKDKPHTGKEMIRRAEDHQGEHREWMQENLFHHYETEGEFLRCAELGEKEYIKECLFSNRKRHVKMAATGTKERSKLAWMEEHLVSDYGLPLGPVEKWSEEDWDNVVEFVKWANSRGVKYHGQVKFVLPLPKLKINSQWLNVDGTYKKPLGEGFIKNRDFFCGWGWEFTGLRCTKEYRKELLQKRTEEMSFVP